jgi:hypothetical protein
MVFKKLINWDLDSDQVIIVAGRYAEPLALKHHMYICQNDRSFRPAKYIAFYKAGGINYLFELVDKPYKDCTPENTPILKTLSPDEFPDPEVPRQIFYLRKVEGFMPIQNTKLDKNNDMAPFTQNQRYATYSKIISAKTTDELED